MIFSGISILGSIVVPVAVSQWQFNYYKQSALIDPMATNAIETQDQDYTTIENWFTGELPNRPAVISKVSYYTLSIPSIKLEEVSVEIDGTDLKKNAIQYPGTAIPGTYGNTVIFGHSTLPSLYKKFDPISIFNPILKIKVGDEIEIYYDGITYRYLVRETLEVSPTAIEVLTQRFDRHELTLVTCTPLGTYLRRFVVRAELVN